MCENQPRFAVRPSRMLRKLRRGEPVFSVKLNVSGMAAAELAAMHGFDAIWTCMEHVPCDFSLIEAQIMAAKIHDCDTVVRVPRGSYSDAVRPLEMDAAALMIPHVLSAEDAAQIVRSTRFWPLGRRALDGGNADACYCNCPASEYLQNANEQRLLILQIEDPEALDDLDAIASVKGYDMLFFGPGDYAHALGLPGQVQHGEVLRARRLVAEAARRHGKWAGTVNCWPVPELLAEGYRYVNLGSDVFALNQYYERLSAEAGTYAGTVPANG